MRHRRVLGLSLFLSLAGCGARTGLRVGAPDDVVDAPDVMDVMDATAEPDAMEEPDVLDVLDVPQEPEAPPVCMPGRFTLARSSAELMFVIDRSGSMGFALDGTPALGMTPSRWTLLRDALAVALPPVERSLALGAKFYPRVTVPGTNPGSDVTCAPLPGVDLAPALGASAAIVRVLDDTDPFGPSPTWGALDETLRFLRARPQRGVSRAIVLATDGGPNCNFTPPAVCRCTSTSCPMTRPDWATTCLDDTRTLTILREASQPTSPAVQPIPVFVVGIDEPIARGPDFRDLLGQMAVAGGRPRLEPGQLPYYSIRRAEDLTAALNTVIRAVNRCTYVTPSRPDNPDEIDIEVDGATATRDPMRVDGWDWTNRDEGEIAFFGGACMRVAGETVRVTARVGCRDR